MDDQEPNCYSNYSLKQYEKKLHQFRSTQCSKPIHSSFNYIHPKKAIIDERRDPAASKLQLGNRARAEIRAGWMWRNNGASCVVHLAC